MVSLVGGILLSWLVLVVVWMMVYFDLLVSVRLVWMR